METIIDVYDPTSKGSIFVKKLDVSRLRPLSPALALIFL
jgi:hypothetical protein